MCSVIKLHLPWSAELCKVGTSTTGHVQCAILQNAQLYHHWFEIVVSNARNSTMCYIFAVDSEVQSKGLTHSDLC